MTRTVIDVDTQVIRETIEHCVSGKPGYCRGCPLMSDPDCTSRLARWLEELLASRPEVIYCEDCKHSVKVPRGKKNPPETKCILHGGVSDCRGFCSRGERKDEEVESDEAD